MLKTYLKLALRNLWKRKSLTALNLLGLSIGFSFFLLIGSFIWSEIHINSIIKDNDRVYLLQSKWSQAGQGSDVTTVAPLSKELYNNYHYLIESYYHYDVINSIVTNGDKHFTEQIQIGDSTFLHIFGLKLLYGSTEIAMQKPNSVIITLAKAIKYFGKPNVVGEYLSIKSSSGESKSFEITGVLGDLPYNTAMNLDGSNQMDFFMPESNLAFFNRNHGFNSWSNVYIVNYIKLRKGVTPRQLDEPIKQLIKSNSSADIRENIKVYLTSMRGYYLLSNSGSAIKTIEGLSLLSFFVLLMGMINYVNISVGNSISRLKVRKLLGGTKLQLIMQFLIESVVLVFISYLISLLLYLLFRGYFTEVIGKDIPGLFEISPFFLVFSLLFIIIFGAVLSLYPAFILSVQPMLKSLKGKLGQKSEKGYFLKTLIIFQFVSAIIVFTSAIIIIDQVNFFFKSDLGYNKNNIITARLPRNWSIQGIQNMEIVRNEFMKSPQVKSASLSYEIPDGQSRNSNNNIYKLGQDSVSGINATILTTDENFINTYDIPLLAGSYFTSKGLGKDLTNTVLNQSAVKLLGWASPDQAIGQLIHVQGYSLPFTVVGVIKDFHFGSMRDNIQPIFITHVRSETLYRYISLKLSNSNDANNIASLQNKWTELLRGAPFEYSYLDDTLANLYQSELRIKKASLVATIVAFIVIMLGILSITMLSLTKRFKEIGVRKVLGASASQIVWQFMKEFSILVIISNCVAWPIAYFLLKNWLNNYVYRINLTVIPFLLATVIIASFIALIITLTTIKTALNNPVKSLRSE
jgi:putative ABC transport system permease protein